MTHSGCSLLSLQIQFMVDLCRSALYSRHLLQGYCVLPQHVTGVWGCDISKFKSVCSVNLIMLFKCPRYILVSHWSFIWFLLKRRVCFGSDQCEKVISIMLSQILDESFFIQSLVLFDSKLNIPSQEKWCHPQTRLYRVLFLRKMCFNWLNQVDSKDLFQLNWLKGKISKYIFLLYEEINEVDLKTTLVIIGNHASWWAKSNNLLANNNILVLELSLAVINRVFSIPVRV